MQLGADPILLYRELCESMDIFGGPHHPSDLPKRKLPTPPC